MSEDTTVLEERIPITIRDKGNAYTLKIPEFTDIDELLQAVGADYIRRITPLKRFYTDKNGVEKSEPDPIIGPWHRDGKFYSESIYEICNPDQDKLRKYIETYS